MENAFWPKALSEACYHTYHPALHDKTAGGIVMDFLWHWADYPSDVRPHWEHLFRHERDEEERFVQDLFPIVQRALAEGHEEDRVFALFLLGGLATPPARDLLLSYLASPYRKERWASALSLGRLKEERVFTLLQTLLLEGFVAGDIFPTAEELQAAQEAGLLYPRSIAMRRQAECTENFWRVVERLREMDYEWYLRQRSECALVLGAWGNTMAIPNLREALQAVWKMEQDWPNYEGPDESGPAIWHFFQDRLLFALGQFGAWDVLDAFPFSETHLLVARIYLILGALQVTDSRIFYRSYEVFRYSLSSSLIREGMERVVEVDPLVESAPVKQLLAKHFGLSPAEQDDALLRFSKARYERERAFTDSSPVTRVSGNSTGIEWIEGEWDLL